MQEQTPVLEEKEVEKLKPAIPAKNPSVLKWVAILVIALAVVGIGLLSYQRVIAPSLVKPSPTPVPTVPAWKTVSENNVNGFMDAWIKSIGTTNSAEYAAKAKELMTIAAQAKLLTYKDRSGSALTDISAQLTQFVGTPAPKTYTMSDTTQVDDQTVDIRITFSDKQNTIKIFTTKSEDGVWLIDSVRDWGSDITN